MIQVWSNSFWYKYQSLSSRRPWAAPRRLVYSNTGRRHINMMMNFNILDNEETIISNWLKNHLGDKNNWLKHSIFQSILSNVKLFDSKKQIKVTSTKMEASRCLTHQSKKCSKIILMTKRIGSNIQFFKVFYQNG